MIGREHDPIDAYFEQEIQECRGEVEAAEGVVDILAEIEADRMLKVGHGHGHNIEPLQHERQAFAHVPNHDLQFGISIEDSTKNETDDMDRGLDVPSPTWSCQHVTYYGRETCV